MKAKQYLEQVYFLDQCINDKLLEIERLRDLSLTISKADMSKERVQTSNKPDIIGDVIPALVDLKEEINRKIDEYVDKKREIESNIEKLTDEQLKVLLLKRYIHLKSWKQISLDLCYSYVHTIRLHNKALKAFDEVY